MCEVVTADTYEKNKPKPGGLSDARMGTTDRSVLCLTDGCDQKDSPGYFGNINLAIPVYHMGLIRTVLKVLRSVSFYNSKVLITEQDKNYKSLSKIKNPERRLSRVHSACVGKAHRACPHTGEPLPRFTMAGMKINAHFTNKLKGQGEDDELGTVTRAENQEITAEKALEILSRISDDDAKFLGFSPKYSRPEWMIIQVLPVPPPPVRPAVVMDGGAARAEDDITYKLAEIVKANNNLKYQKESGAA